jgi:hypothetical protein
LKNQPQISPIDTDLTKNGFEKMLLVFCREWIIILYHKPRIKPIYTGLIGTICDLPFGFEV